MPIYDYHCAACGHRFEVVHGVHDAGPADCPACGAREVRKAIAAPAIVFKGSGWAKKERSAAAKPAAGDGATKTDDKAGDAKAADPAPASSKGSTTEATGGSGAAAASGTKTATD